MTKELASGIALEVGALMVAILVGISIWALVDKGADEDMAFLWIAITMVGTVALLSLVPVGIYKILMGH